MTETPHTTPQAPSTPPALQRLGLVFDALTTNLELLFVLEQALHAEGRDRPSFKSYAFTVAHIRQNVEGAQKELDDAFMQVVDLEQRDPLEDVP